MNDNLERSQYFFSDIKREGVLLYDSKEFILSEPKILNEEERKKIVKEDYNHWFNRANRFLRHFQVDLEENDCKGAAFQLHQATEGFYDCALLILTVYKPKSHNLEDLNQLCSAQSNY